MYISNFGTVFPYIGFILVKKWCNYKREKGLSFNKSLFSSDHNLTQTMYLLYEVVSQRTHKANRVYCLQFYKKTFKVLSFLKKKRALKNLSLS